MEENKWMITWNSFKLDLNAWKFKTEIDNANQTKVYKSKKSNSSSLFSDDEEILIKTIEVKASVCLLISRANCITYLCNINLDSFI